MDIQFTVKMIAPNAIDEEELRNEYDNDPLAYIRFLTQEEGLLGCVDDECIEIIEAHILDPAAASSLAALQDEAQPRHPRLTHGDHQRIQETLDSLSECPTEEEAEAVLQACGTSGKEVVNDFIERLLRENLELKTRLSAAAKPSGAAGFVDELRGRVVFLTARLHVEMGHEQTVHHCEEGECGYTQALIGRTQPGDDVPAAAAPVADACWHCGDVLTPAPKPCCENCPEECDVEGCDEMGCAPAAASLAAPAADVLKTLQAPATCTCNDLTKVQQAQGEHYDDCPKSDYGESK